MQSHEPWASHRGAGRSARALRGRSTHTHGVSARVGGLRRGRPQDAAECLPEGGSAGCGGGATSSPEGRTPGGRASPEGCGGRSRQAGTDLGGLWNLHGSLVGPVEGPPGRCSSVSTQRTSSARSESLAPSRSAAASRSSALAHRARHRRTRCRSTPSWPACSTLVTPVADSSTIRLLSTNLYGVSALLRTHLDRIPRCRSDTATSRACPISFKSPCARLRQPDPARTASQENSYCSCHQRHPGPARTTSRRRVR